MDAITLATLLAVMADLNYTDTNNDQHDRRENAAADDHADLDPVGARHPSLEGSGGGHLQNASHNENGQVSRDDRR